MTSGLIVPYGSREARRDLRGSQVPRIESVPPYASSAGHEAVEVARLGGIDLDPWQERQIVAGMGESPDWKCSRCVHRRAEPEPCADHPRAGLIHPWAAFEVVSVAVRQVGKSENLLARMLYGAFVLEEPLQIFSAHLFDTAMEIFLRLITIVENTPEFASEVRLNRGKIGSYSHGNEGITLKCGARIRFKARTGGGGRGFTCNTLYLDEAMILPERFLGTTVPTLSAIPNPQLWLAGSAVDEEDPAHDGVVLSKRRERALKGNDRSMAYFEHSAPGDDPGAVPAEVLDDPKVWEEAIPALGFRIAVETVENERGAMGARQFAVERLGIGAWVVTDGSDLYPIPKDAWKRSADPAFDSTGITPVCFAFDVPPDRSSVTIAGAMRRPDRKWYVAIIDRLGMDEAPARLAALKKAHRPKLIVCEASSPAASLLPALELAHVTAEALPTKDYAAACGLLQDAVAEDALRHSGGPLLSDALDGARRKILNDAKAWKWSKQSSTVDISPLVAVTLALWASQTTQKRGSMVVDLSAIAAEMSEEERAAPLPWEDAADDPATVVAEARRKLLEGE